VPKPSKRPARAAGKVAQTSGEPDTGTSPPKSDYDDAEILEKQSDGTFKSWTLIHQETEARLAQTEARLAQSADENTALAMQVHDLTMENRRLREIARTGRRGASLATQAYTNMARTMLDRGQPRDEVFAVLCAQFSDWEHPHRAAKRTLKLIEAE
jgi:hypothetical protein